MAAIARLSITALVSVLTINAAGNAAGNDGNGTSLIGYIDTTGAVVIEPQFIYATDFSEGVAGVLPKDSERCGIIDENGTMIVSPRFRGVGMFVNGLAPAGDQHDHCGFINKQGEFVIPPQYDDAFEFSDGMAMVMTIHGQGQTEVLKRGFVDTSGKVVVPLQFDWVGDFSEGFAYVQRNDRWNYVDKSGRLLIPQWLDFTTFGFSENRAPIKKDGLWGYIDNQGEMVIAPRFSTILPFKFGHAMVALNNDQEIRIIDRMGRFSTDRTFETISEFHEGLAFVRDGDALECIDTQGRTVIGSEKLAGIDNIPEFHEGLAAVEIKGRYGYINKTGDLVIKPQPSFVQAGDFSSGRARITAGRNVLWTVVDRSGRIVE